MDISLIKAEEDAVASTNQPIHLTQTERERMNKTAVRGLVNIVIAQSIGLLIVLVLAALIAGEWAMWSALAGGFAYLLPSTLFVLFMLHRIHARRNASAITFFYGEGFKLITALALLVVTVVVLGADLVWPAYIVGLVVVLKAYVLLLIFRKL